MPESAAERWFPAVIVDVPLMTFLGAQPIDENDPAAGLSLTVTERALNAGGVVHGGVITSILDLAAYLAVLPTLAADEQAVTHALSASLMASTGIGDTLVARGDLIRRGRTIAFTSATVMVDDRLIATASVTKSIIRA